SLRGPLKVLPMTGSNQNVPRGQANLLRNLRDLAMGWWRNLKEPGILIGTALNVYAIREQTVKMEIEAKICSHPLDDGCRCRLEQVDLFSAELGLGRLDEQLRNDLLMCGENLRDQFGEKGKT